MHFSAKRSIAIACRLSVCPSGCDVGGSGSHRSEILETNCMDTKPNTFALRSPKVIHLLPGEHGEIFGRVEVGWVKMACWSTKSAISLKRVKIEEKLLWGAYRKAPVLFQMVPSPTSSFYRAMHFSAKRAARYCDRMSSVRPSVRLSVCP